MKKNMIKHESTVKYHIVFCPKYKRKIFNIEGLRERVHMLICTEFKKRDISIIELDCGSNYVHMYVEAQPTISAHDICFVAKKATGTTLQNEYPELSSMSALWTRAYFVTTDTHLSQKDIQQYVDSVPNGPSTQKES